MNIETEKRKYYLKKRKKKGQLVMKKEIYPKKISLLN